MFFVRKCHVFFVITCIFDVCHYLIILCHFDQMNDKMMFFFFLLNKYFFHCNASRLVAPNYVRFMHHLGVLILYEWLWLYKSLVETFEL